MSFINTFQLCFLALDSRLLSHPSPIRSHSHWCVASKVAHRLTSSGKQAINKFSLAQDSSYSASNNCCIPSYVPWFPLAVRPPRFVFAASFITFKCCEMSSTKSACCAEAATSMEKRGRAKPAPTTAFIRAQDLIHRLVME